MTDIMYPISFDRLMKQIIEESKTIGTIFGVEKVYKTEVRQDLIFAGEKLENPLGLAAGPHTQLAQNIVASYAAGGRFMETKTVQSMYGDELGIPRPCMRADDEAYNVEWSAEFSPRMAAEEYIKAYIACYIMAIEFELGDPGAFQFNMSVGYNLEGIKEKSVDEFLNVLNDASEDKFYLECKEWLKENINLFSKVKLEDVENIPYKICNTTTLSTMHGCPAKEIEDIISHLQYKGLNTMLKLNPTLLGYDYVKTILNELGYGYIGLRRESFETDLQKEDAIPMIKRLINSAEKKNLFFGVKLSNTLEVINNGTTLPGGDSMYMSGKALYPLTISLAYKLAEVFDGQLPVSYCGGAHKNNIVDIYKTGIYPITVCTDLLTGQGYNKLEPMATLLVKEKTLKHGIINTIELKNMMSSIISNKENHKTERSIQRLKNNKDYNPIRQKDSIDCKVLCMSCIRVCPNRANTKIELSEDRRVILHIDMYCNECGNCQFGCIEPCAPYLDRLTIFENKEQFNKSNNSGFYKEGYNYYSRLYNKEYFGDIKDMPNEIKNLILEIKNQQPWLLY